MSVLPVTTRDVFLLNRVEGLDYKIIGRRLGLTGRAVENHMAKAIVHVFRVMEFLEQGK